MPRLSGRQRTHDNTHDVVDVDREICCNVQISRHFVKHVAKANKPPVDDQLRRVFYVLKGLSKLYREWPERTSLLCWYCRLPFNTQPVPIVVQYDEVKDIYECEGVACNLPCAMAYLNDKNESAKAMRMMHQTKMAVQVMGWPRGKPVPTANTWKAIDVFGGNLTVEEWRLQEYPIKIRAGNFVPASVLLECKKRGIADEDQVLQVASKTREELDREEEESVNLPSAEGFDVRHLKRGEVIDSMDRLKEIHPDFVANENIVMDSIFNKWKETEVLPTDDECKNILTDRRLEKSRRRKKTVKSLAATTASTFSTTEADDDQPEGPPSKRSRTDNNHNNTKSKNKSRIKVDVATPRNNANTPGRKPASSAKRKAVSLMDLI